MKIREMTQEDIPQVAAIEKGCFSMPWSQQGFLDSLNSKDTLYLVVEINGEIIGYCGLLQSFDEADITNVAVKESRRGHQVATTMLVKLLEEGEKRGIQGFTLEVRKSNADAIHVYEKLGFVGVGYRKKFYDNPVEDGFIMWKR